MLVGLFGISIGLEKSIFVFKDIGVFFLENGRDGSMVNLLCVVWI